MKRELKAENNIKCLTKPTSDRINEKRIERQLVEDPPQRAHAGVSMKRELKGSPWDQWPKPSTISCINEKRIESQMRYYIRLRLWIGCINEKRIESLSLAVSSIRATSP